LLQDVLRFNGIDIIESIPDGELRTGRDLYESVVAPLAFNASPELKARFHEIETADDLLGVLADVQHRAETQGIYPILHIEAHGSSLGLGLRSGGVTWMDLLEALTAINTACRLNLLVAMSACWGADITRILHPVHPAPFWGTVGPSKEMDAGPLYGSFAAFYRSYLTAFDGKAAIDAMRTAALPQSAFMAFRSAEIMFRHVFFRYIERHSSGEPLEARVRKIIGWIIDYDPSAEENRGEVEQWLRGRILDHEVHFERYKAAYFMYDQFPENRTRFNPLYAEGPPW
jgi:hypothetical protein